MARQSSNAEGQSFRARSPKSKDSNKSLKSKDSNTNKSLKHNKKLVENTKDVAVIVYSDENHESVGAVGTLEYYDKNHQAWMVEMPDGTLVE